MWQRLLKMNFVKLAKFLQQPTERFQDDDTCTIKDTKKATKTFDFFALDRRQK